MKKDFDSLYSELTSHESDLYEIWNKVKKDKKIKNTIIILVLLFSIAVLIIIIKTQHDSLLLVAKIMIFVDILGLVILEIIFHKSSMIYNDTYKQNVVEKLISNFFDEVDYVPKKEMSRNIYNEVSYNESYNEYVSDDYIDAKIDDKYNIKMAEVKTMKETTYTDSDGETRTETVTVFWGLFAKIEINKFTKNLLQIRPDRTIGKRQRLEMDSTEFEKYFDVKSENNIVGMQMLTSDIMELLLNFRKELGKPIDIDIVNNCIYIRLHVGKMFESKVNNKEIIDREKTKIYYSMLKFIYDLSKQVIEIGEGDY